MSASKKTSAINQCLIWVTGLPLERYRLPDDGRKWKSRARSRQSLLNFIARFANDDGAFTRRGTNYSPGEPRLMKHFGFSRQWIETLLDDLHRLRLLNWTRRNRQVQREYTVIISDDNYSPKPEDNYSNPDDNYSNQNPVLTTTIQPLTTSIAGSDDKSRVVVSVLPSKEPSRDREPSSADEPNSSISLSSGKPETTKDSGQENDIAVIQAACFACTGKTPNPDHIRPILKDHSQEEIVKTFGWYVHGLSDRDRLFAEKTFFADRGWMGVFLNIKQSEWEDSLRIVANDPEEPVDEFVESDPPPMGLAHSARLINAAKKTHQKIMEKYNAEHPDDEWPDPEADAGAKP